MRNDILHKHFLTTTSILSVALLVFSGVKAESWNGSTGVEVVQSRKYIDWEQIQKELDILLSNEDNSLRENYTCSATQSSTPNNSETSNALCDCNDECILYGGCCIETAVQQWNDGLDPDYTRYFCGSLSSLDTLEGVVMTGHCHHNFTDSNIENLCRQDTSREVYNYLLEIPVISQGTNITYVNYYCALCNDDANELVNISQFIMECTSDEESNDTNISDDFSKVNISDFVSRGRYIMSHWAWRGYLNDSTGNGEKGSGTVTCRIKNIEYEDHMEETKIYETKSCMYPYKTYPGKNDLKHVEYCNASWPYVEHEYICRRYSMRVFDNENNIVYGNPHCARCNFVNISSSPNISFTRRTFLTDYTRPSYTFVFPINSSLQTSCEDGNIWDFLHEKCTSFICGSYYVREEGICVYDRQGSLVTFTVLLISQICLCLHIILYFTNKSSRNCHETNLLCLSFSLFLAQLLFMVGIYEIHNHPLCVSISVILHYFWLASFFWMNILSIDIFRTFNNNTGILFANKKRTLKYYNAYAWGLPFLIVFLAVTVDLADVLQSVQPHYANKMICWITNSSGLILYFLAPIGIIILENFILFVMTSYKIYQKSKETRILYLKSKSTNRRQSTESESTESESKQRRKNNIRLVLYIKLGLLQGTTWMMAFIAGFVDNDILWEIFTVVNGLQGTYIFFSFDLKELCSVPCWKTIRDHVSSGRRSENSNDSEQ